ncbi:MAG: 2-5 ligase [Solirubrobacterales bacterium]|nr:2-5 ligase [Solirubrobacterales bacterium]
MPTRGNHPTRGSHRLFVALDPPAAVAAELAGWARGQRTRGGGLRVIAPDRIHLTLAFLGERPVVEVDPIAWAVDGAVGEWAQAGEGGPVPLALGPPVWLPPRHPRALAVGVRDPTGRLGALRDAFGLSLGATVGWRAQGRRFRPHLTVARLSGRRGVLGPLEPTPAASFTVGEAVLYRSFLEPGGARYEALERVRLT